MKATVPFSKSTACGAWEMNVLGDEVDWGCSMKHEECILDLYMWLLLKEVNVSTF